MYSGVRRAILSRLTGFDNTQVDEALRKLGIGLDAGQVNRALGSQSSFQPNKIGFLNQDGPAFGGTPVQRVPVYPFDLTGTDIDTWPAVSIWLTNFLTRREGYLYKDPIYRDVPNSSKTIRLSDGTTVVRADLKMKRPHPRPFDLTWNIRVDSRYETELGLIIERIYDLLDERGYLTIQLRNDSHVTYDTRIETPQPMSKPEGTFEPGDAAEHSLILPFVVEAYADNSTAEEMVRVIRERTIAASTEVAESDPVTTCILDAVEEA